MYSLKYSQKFRGQKNKNNKKTFFVYTKIKFYHTSFLFPVPLVHAHLPHHGELNSFALRKDEKALAIYELLLYDENVMNKEIYCCSFYKRDRLFHCA